MSEKQIGSPVFICGYPKSGTTLLLALLDRHPQMLVFPEESKFFKLVLNHPERCNPDYILTYTGAKSLKLGEFRYASGYRDYSGVDFEAFQSCLTEKWSTGEQTEPALLEAIMTAYGHATNQAGKEYWVEKSPLNEQYLHRVEPWWRDLSAIYMIRDPRDNYCSYRKLRQKRFEDRKRMVAQDSANEGTIEFKKEKSSVPPPLSLEEFIAYWLESLHNWEKYAVQNSRTLLLRYEDLVYAPQEALERVCAFLAIEWDDILMSPTRNGVFWSGNSMHGIEFDGISSDSVGRYQDLLTADEIRFLEVWLGDAMKCYGYAPEQTNNTHGISLGNLALKSKSKWSVKARMIRGFLQSKTRNKEQKYA